jgi:hypothetical protein
LRLAERAWHSYVARQFDAARAQAIATLDLQRAFAPALFARGLGCEQLGAFDQALAAFAAIAPPSRSPAARHRAAPRSAAQRIGAFSNCSSVSA